MSHFTVTVALPAETAPSNLKSALANVLARYDENREVPRYVAYTKAELISNGRKEIGNYRETVYAKYLADPRAYALEHNNNPAHLKYLAGNSGSISNLPARPGDLATLTRTDDDGGFPAKLTWTDEQVWADAVRWYEAEDIGPGGEVYSESNPESKWDWYQIGGRWAGAWALNAIIVPPPPNLTQKSWATGAVDGSRVDVARVQDIDHASIEPAFALVDLEGAWHERGEMGWFAMVSNEKDADVWRAQYMAAVAALPTDTWLINVDCHI